METLFAVKYSFLIPLLPLIGAAISGFFGARWLKQQSHWPIWLGVGASAVLSFILLAQVAGHHASPAAPGVWSEVFHSSVTRHLYTWFQAGSFKADVGFFIDPLTAVMLCVVTGIGFLITVFAKGYMAGEEGYFRFFAYLGLFIFAMTILVMADNFVLLYLGWEGVGLCSYLLIGYFYQKPAAREAAKKAFLVNRVGDFGFGLGIMLIFLIFGTVSFFGTPAQPGALIGAATPGLLTPWQQAALWWVPFLLMIGAFGKSAQFPLYVWLPDAMEGPTPVSALIHAATMVTAGVYMIVRCGTIFMGNSAALLTIAAVGAFTAIFAAAIALRQFDLKKVFAYSTISQLGFMFVGAAVLAPVAAIFHLVTHAFFKALLFLSSGVVMHAMMGELDMRKMSGLKRVMPWTNALMLVGCLALAGFPLFSGFFSKDEILAAAWNFDSTRILGLILLLTAFLTAYYTFRLYFRVFQGPLVLPAAPLEAHDHDHGPADAHAHASAAAVQTGDAAESGVDKHLEHDAGHHGAHHNHEPMVMILPLVLLALGAIFIGYINWPEREHFSLAEFLGQSPSMRLAHAVANREFGAGRVMPAEFGAHDMAEDKVKEATHALHINMMAASGLIALLGIYVAYLLHRKYRERGDELPRKLPRLSRLIEAKFWVDEVYQQGIVEPLRNAGRAFFAVDRLVIDGILWIIAFVPQLSGFALKLTTQRGSLQGYAVLMLGVVAIILWVVLL